MDLLEQFKKKQIIRSQLQTPEELNVWLDHCEWAVHSEFNKNNKELYKFKKRKKQISIHFRNAFQQANREEKVLFYIRIVTHLQNFSQGFKNPPPLSQLSPDALHGVCECRSFNLKVWKQKNIMIDRATHEIMVENDKDGKIKTYNLRQYFLRKSKIKDKFVFVLEAINDKPHQKSRTVHIAFNDTDTLTKWYNLVKQEVEYCEWLFVKQLFQNFFPSKNLQSNPNLTMTISEQNTLNSSYQKQNISQSQISENQLLKVQQQLEKQESNLLGFRQTLVDHLVNDDISNEEFFDIIDNETQNEVQIKKNMDFFHKLMPDYDLKELTELGNYQTVLSENQHFQIYRSIDTACKYKVFLTFKASVFSQKQLFCILSQPKFANRINSNIEEQSVKTFLKSENSAIVYQTLKVFNKFYRLRDFIFVRHAFTHNDNFYMVDKSLDNINFPPFMTLVRGEISAVWGIIKDNKSEELKLVGDFVIMNAGLLNEQQETNLSVKYLTGFKELLRQEPESGVDSSMFDIDWNIDKKEVNKKFEEIRHRRRTIQLEKEKMQGRQIGSVQDRELIFSKKSSNYSTNSSPQQISNSERKQIQIEEWSPTKSSPEVSPKKTGSKISLFPQKVEKDSEFKTELEVSRKVDSEGYIIINPDYVKAKHFLIPVQKQSYNELPKIKGHAIWKGDWLRDGKDGGVLFINQKKIEDQKGVLKFVLTKIGKNILSGKGVLSISLPVDILSTQSNLEKLLFSMGYGPKLLENLNGKSVLEKFAKVVPFGVSNSVLYINLDKPFNPILGQTFQCWINGCPGYGQQISHHPPIAALLFMGRGYRITCQLESKVQLHMNSGSGINDGIYKVQFDDGTQIFFVTPPNQITGLSYGDRKFNLIGKSYYWSQKDRIFLELNFQIGKKGFFSKSDKPTDYFEGKIYEVRAQFFNNFYKNKKKELTDKEKVRQLGSFQGIWNKYIKFNSEEVLNFDTNVPLKLEYEYKPLASDSNWREDIEYRRLNKITRAQTEKQRLEVLQRTDRKFRQKYAKK